MYLNLSEAHVCKFGVQLRQDRENRKLELTFLECISGFGREVIDNLRRKHIQHAVRNEKCMNAQIRISKSIQTQEKNHKKLWVNFSLSS